VVISAGVVYDVVVQTRAPMTARLARDQFSRVYAESYPFRAAPLGNTGKAVACPEGVGTADGASPTMS
jgi:hypothetical protein